MSPVAKGPIPRAVRASVAFLVATGLVAGVGLLVPASTTSGCCVAPPSREHLLGRAADGRDLLRAVAEGLGTSAAICLCATGMAILLGLAWGAWAATRSSTVERGLMRIVDVLRASPTVLFIIILAVVVRLARPPLTLDHPPLWDDRLLLVTILAAVEWLTVARVVHARLSALRRRPFVEAARAMGMSRWRVLRVHLLRHAAPPLGAYAVLTLPSAFALEGLVSFLGFGVEAPHVSLGTLLRAGAEAMSVAPLTMLVPAGAFIGVTIALHVVGAWLRDRLRIEERA